MKSKILLILILAVLAASCFLDPIYRTYQEYKLTSADKKMIPYKLKQNINFIDSLGKPFVLTVTQDKIKLCNDDSDAFGYERRDVRLLSETGYLDIWLRIEANYDGSNDKFKNKYINIWIGQYVYYLYYNWERQFVANTFNLEINNKIYYDVVECIHYTANQNNEQLLSMRLLYNKTYGILQLEDKDKVLFSINN
jgi:hypothetical protein